MMTETMGLENLQKHFADGDAIAVFSVMHKGISDDERKMNLDKLKGKVKLAHFAKNEIVGEYLEADGSVTEERTFSIFAGPERAQEVRDFAYGMGKKYKQDVVLYGFDGTLKYISTKDDSSIGSIGTTVEIGNKLDLAELEKFFSKAGGREFRLREISADISHSYDSFMTRQISDLWDQTYKKYGPDAVEQWDKGVRDGTEK